MNRLTSYSALVIFFLMLSIVSCNNQEKDDHVVYEAAKRFVYTCPMHPEVTRDAPGSCPICGMDLQKKVETGKNMDTIRFDDLLKPTNEFVISTIPVTTMERKEENIELDVLGNVAYDTRQIGTITSRASGRIEKLYIRYRYQLVRKGQKVMDIYSPELATAQQNLLFLVRNDPGNTTLIQAAEQRLILLGLNKEQINQVVSSKKIMYSVSVYSSYAGFATDFARGSANTNDMNTMANPTQELNIKEGMYLQKGQAVFSVYNADKAWILLNLYPEQQALVRIGNPVSIVPETSPQHGFSGRIDYIEPLFRQSNKTVTARVNFRNNQLGLPIGSRVKAKIFGNIKDAMWLPKEAVLSLGRNRIVFVKEASGFRAREINTGLVLSHSIEIIKGLSLTDSVAANAHYLVDNEAFIKIR